ncbi:DUF4148 domain-containing protein [Paraburkholderia sp.]|uniref:DUF4148 domain-containing protein n=1 Tax=Paraburkholderia sp. TaxID=1926495 RepID=UPI002393E3CA|nr:DUF4148 domain-containing protein [Paraburkholderia sp.]MDE1179272.1 DUF4148 domain-containing protein [Paraburkholderia sp.]
MTLATKTLALAALLISSASAMAAPHLTQQQCSDYPFTHTKNEVSHAQLQRELGELESRGYSPGDDASQYPYDLERAEAKLQVDFRHDCLPAAHATQTSATIQHAG